MDCCGRGRAAARAAAPARGLPGGVSTTAGPTPGAGGRPGPGVLRWRRRVSAEVRGPVTGRAYVVSAASPVVVVDAADAADLLATGFFDRVG